MISKRIVDTDLFLNMPVSSRLLYYDLLIRADDDGFVGSPKMITRMIGASEDDLRVLTSKKFIIPFSSGVCVIRDWRIHNYIKNDRYQPTQYVSEKAKLKCGASKEYLLSGTELEPERIQNGTEPEPNWNQTGSEMDTQVRLELGKSKGRIGKDRGMGETIPDFSADKPPDAESTPYSEIESLYLSLCPSFPRIQKLSSSRKKAIHARWVQYHDIEAFRKLFDTAESSEFLKGKNDRNWSADFDWMLKDANMAKILEGKYGKRNRGNLETSNPFAEIRKEMET